MDKIKIVERDGIKFFEQVHELLYEAHATNREKGFHVKTAELSAEELIKGLGPNGKCFAAIDGDKIVGVMAVRFVQRDCWYAKGLTADPIYGAIRQDYRGRHLSTALYETIEKIAIDLGVKQIEVRIASNNVVMRHVFEKCGFQYVDFRANHNLDHYTVVLCKWLSIAPHSLRCSLHYKFKKIRTTLLYNPGRQRRF